MTADRPETFRTWVDGSDPLARLPKASLHDHLDGSLQPATIIEIARAVGAELPTEDPDVLEAWFQRRPTSIPPLTDWRVMFALTTAVMQRAEDLRRIARDYVHLLAADGVVYAETRWAPEQHVFGGLSMDAAVAAVAEGLAEGVDDVRAGGHEVAVYQVLSIMRHARNGVEIAELAARTADLGVVGIDLAGMEIGNPASEHADAYRRAAELGVHRTVHAAEMVGAESLRDALDSCEPERIGHGTRVAEDIAIDGREVPVAELVAAWRAGGQVDPGPLATEVAERGLVLEQCVSSNTGPMAIVAELDQHPIDVLRAAGIAVSVNPDNRMISGVSITGEYRILADRFGWGEADFAAAFDAALRSGFGPSDVRERLRG